MKPDYVAVGLRLKESRKQSQLTQQELAKFAGISVSYVKNTERGGKPSIEYLLVVSERCNKSIDWLLTGDYLNDNSQAQEVEALLDTDLQQMIDVLKNIWQEQDQELRIWAKIQFKKAFAEHCAITAGKNTAHSPEK